MKINGFHGVFLVTLINDIMDDNEKRGRTPRPRRLINGFRQVALDSGLSDVSVEGYPFTWFKSLRMPQAVEERLDSSCK